MLCVSFVLWRRKSDGKSKKRSRPHARRAFAGSLGAGLGEAIAAGNVEEAFRAAHTLKGVCLNLGFDNLYKASSAITEIFRAGELAGAEEAFEEVEKQYNITVNAIKAM